MSELIKIDYLPTAKNKIGVQGYEVYSIYGISGTITASGGGSGAIMAQEYFW